MDSCPHFVYEFLYNPCVWESAYYTVSLHYSLAGAYKAMQQHRDEKYREWRNEPKIITRRFKFGSMESWAINKQMILP